MTLFLKIVGLGLLLHAGYSSYEFSHAQKSHNTTLPFPTDITYEVLISLFIIVIDLLFLTPTEGKLSLVTDDVLRGDYKLRPIFMKDALIEDEKLGAGPFKTVETRPTFVDVHGMRKKYAEWAAKNEDVEKKEDKKVKDEKKEEKKDEKKEKVMEEVKEEPKVEATSTPEPKSQHKETKSKKKNGNKSKKS